MTEQDAIFEIRTECWADLYGALDHEVNHQMADQILCNFLRANGFSNLADAFERVVKYYA